MQHSYSAVKDNKFTRKWGGSNGDAVDPYISGYFFTHWPATPAMTKIYQAISQSPSRANVQEADIPDILESTCLSVTIPGGTLNKAEYNGLGGTRFSVPTNVEFDNTVTMKFLEFSSLPILEIFHGWVRLIRDYRTGVTHVMDTGADNDYTKSNYSTAMYYWTTKPDGRTIEYYACMTGLFPMKDPQDQYGADITAYDKLELDIDFNIDYMFHEPWVYTNCQTYANNVYTDRDIVNQKYREPAQ